MVKRTVGSDPVVVGTGLKMLLSPTATDLAQLGAAVLAGPCEPGRLGWPSRPGKFQFVVGDFQGGRWLSRERCEPQKAKAGSAGWDLDGDRANLSGRDVAGWTRSRAGVSYLTASNAFNPEQALSY